MTPDVVISLREEIKTLQNRITSLEFELEDIKKIILNNPQSKTDWARYIPNTLPANSTKRDIEFGI